jgi:hypothetical protein
MTLTFQQLKRKGKKKKKKKRKISPTWQPVCIALTNFLCGKIAHMIDVLI